MKELVWNVYCLNNATHEIEPRNVFYHYGFLKDLYKLKKQYLKKGDFRFDDFIKEVERDLKYYYWSKYEWEIVLTIWPPRIEEEELERLKEERETTTKEGQHLYLQDVRLHVSKKVDIYEQVKMNWDAFVEYLRNNYKLIKKPK